MTAWLPSRWLPSRIHARSAVVLTHSLSFRRSHSQSIKPAAPLAFAFDIDGVLCHGRRAIPAALAALQYLRRNNNPLDVDVPFVVITNGGGLSEEKRASGLSEILGYPIDPQCLIQSHTVLKTISHKYQNENVLVLGGLPGIEDLAKSYGFEKVHTSYSILASSPGVWPFADDQASPAQVASPSQLRTQETVRTLEEFSIRAILVFHDPRDWGRDIQLMLDIILPTLRSLTTLKSNPPVELVFCNPDLLWKSDYPSPRLGQGGFISAFQGVFKAMAGFEYPATQLGKPTKATYDFAASVLRSRITLEGEDSHNIYMVGDNLQSDIAGANAANWSSILVRTGVYDPDEPRSILLRQEHPPTHEAADIEEAVKWAVAQVDRESLTQSSIT